ncbi:hypothetical protein Gpo141_00007235 [Globisporangium polare]
MNFRSPPPSREGGVSGSGGARGLRSDSAGSDDSGFGDDSLSQDEYVQLRLQKMNTLMGFGGEPGIDELDVVGVNDISAPPSLDAGIGAYDSALLTEQKGPPPPYSGDKKPLTAYERLQALSLKEGNPSALQLVDEASSLPAPGGERFFGAAAPSQPPAPPFDFDYGNNRTFMADEDEDDDEDDAYVITWEGGQLGLLFKANPAGQVVIRRVNKKGTALGLQSARAGDVLVGLNGITVQGVPFLEIIEQLKNPRFPIKLEFEPLKFGALPPGVIESSGALPSYASYNTGIPGSMGGSRDAPISPTSSSGTVEMTDQDSSFVHVSRPGEDLHEDRLRKNAEYDVVWDEGPLGCGLKNRSGYPTVKTVSSIGVSASVAQIGEGDILIIINGYKTLDIGFKSAITMLQRAPKPIYLRFRRQPVQTSSADAIGSARKATKPSSSRDLLSGVHIGPLQYAVLWSDGPLGIQIKSGNKGLVFVSRLTGAGNPAMTEQITPGDIFVRIADVDVASRGIAGAFELLKSVQKPVVLVFQKVSRHDDDSATAIPSFRRMREEAAGGPSSSTGAHPRGLTRANSAGVRGSNSSHHSRDEYEEAPWQTRTMPNRPSAIDETIRMQKPIAPRSLSCELDYEDESDPGSQRSNARTDYSGVSQQVNVPHDHPPADSNLGDSLPPRFSDIEAGRVVTTEVTALPPPPSYLDMFTQSGRSRDFGEAFHAPPPGSPRSEGQSVSSSHLGDQQHGAFPPPPPAHELDSFAALPPPPQYSSFFPADSGGSGGSRLQELRQQYIESERRRNQTQFGSTFMSSYSDLDDSDVMRQRKSSIPRAPPNPLPLSRPELWVRWSEGPLGITFKRKNGQIVVSRLTGAGFSPGLEQLRTGDWLVSFNNSSTENLKLSETMEMLKRLPKPIDMRFVVQ